MKDGRIDVNRWPETDRMTHIDCRCPNCSLDTVVDDSRVSCYCMYCGFQIQVSSVERTDDGLVNVTVCTPSMRGAEILVLIDGEEALRTLGGSDTIRVTKGLHRITAKVSALTSIEEVDLKEGSRILISVGFMGFKITVSRGGWNVGRQNRRHTDEIRLTGSGGDRHPHRSRDIGWDKRR